MYRFVTAILALLCSVIVSFECVAYNGEIIKIKVDNSTIYPGTERNVYIYVPQAYDGAQPACLWVSMSGGCKFMADIFSLRKDWRLHDRWRNTDDCRHKERVGRKEMAE